MSIICPGSAVPPAVIIARTLESSSAENNWFGGLPLASRSSKRSPMRCISDLGKREKTRTFSGMSTSTQRAELVAQFRPLILHVLYPTSAEQGARLDLHARSHGGGDRDALDIGALGARRLGLGDGV